MTTAARDSPQSPRSTPSKTLEPERPYGIAYAVGLWVLSVLVLVSLIVWSVLEPA